MKLHKKLAVLSLAAATSFGTVFQSLPAVVMAQEIAMSDADEVIDETLGVPALNTDTIARSWHTIAFSWNAVDGAAGYQVLVDGTETVDIAEGTTSVTKDFYAEGAADPTNTQHTFKIRAKKRHQLLWLVGRSDDFHKKFADSDNHRMDWRYLQ